MDAQLIELYVQRGRLRERIRSQRSQLAYDLAPLGDALHAVDYAHSRWQQTQLWLAEHPMVVGLSVMALVLWRPRAVLGWLYRGYTFWRRWRGIRTWFETRLRLFDGV